MKKLERTTNFISACLRGFGRSKGFTAYRIIFEWKDNAKTSHAVTNSLAMLFFRADLHYAAANVSSCNRKTVLWLAVRNTYEVEDFISKNIKGSLSWKSAEVTKVIEIENEEDCAELVRLIVVDSRDQKLSFSTKKLPPIHIRYEISPEKIKNFENSISH